MLDDAVARSVERSAQPRDDQPPYHRGIVETHLGLRRMDVDVDLACRDIEEQCRDRMPVARQHLGIGAADRTHQQPVLHRAPVDDEILVIGDAAIIGWQSRDPAQHDALALHIDRHRVVGERAIGERGDPVRLRLPPRHGQRPSPLVLDAEADIGTCHRQTTDDIDAGGIFRAARAEELPPRGYAREEVLGNDSRPRRQRRRPVAHQLAVVDDAGPAFRACDPTLDRQPCDAGDRGQRLAAETERRDGLDRFVRQLRGRMAFERERHVGRAHAAPVVGDLDPRQPAVAQNDRDATRARIDRVFDQFLQRAGGSFHHFTGGDAVDQMFGQAAY